MKSVTKGGVQIAKPNRATEKKSSCQFVDAFVVLAATTENGMRRKTNKTATGDRANATKAYIENSK